MDDAQGDEATVAASGRRTLRLRRETVRNLTEDLLSSPGYSLWTCPDVGGRPGEPETTYVEIDSVRVEVHIDVRPAAGGRVPVVDEGPVD